MVLKLVNVLYIQNYIQEKHGKKVKVRLSKIKKANEMPVYTYLYMYIQTYLSIYLYYLNELLEKRANNLYIQNYIQEENGKNHTGY